MIWTKQSSRWGEFIEFEDSHGNCEVRRTRTKSPRIKVTSSDGGTLSLDPEMAAQLGRRLIAFARHAADCEPGELPDPGRSGLGPMEVFHRNAQQLVNRKVADHGDKRGSLLAVAQDCFPAEIPDDAKGRHSTTHYQLLQLRQAQGLGAANARWPTLRFVNGLARLGIHWTELFED